ncbi:MAG: SDR family oxidoreductase [Candidatus Coatesbacteria bacterium]|nr:SDR family oxidoreductase [Candidatus Coatesbacteria bacterium]
MPRSIVTGGAGFIGSHLCEHLLANGHEVICIDNLLTGTTDNLAQIKSDRFTFLKYNVTNYLFINGELDYVFHLASPASPVDYLELPIQTMKVGALGTLNALGLAKAKNATFLLASTSEVYGDPEHHPQEETYWGNVNPIGPRGVYDEAKRFAEALTMAYSRYHGVKTRIARIFNTFGPRMRLKDGRVVPNFMCQALAKKPLTVYGDGSQTRSFCYVSDLVEGLYKLMMSSELDPTNIGNPSEMSILEFAKRINQLTGNSAGIVFEELPIDDPKYRRPNIGKAKRVLNWEPKIALAEGLERTLEWFKIEIARTAQSE